MSDRSVFPEVFIDQMGRTWRQREPGMYAENATGLRWTASQLEDTFGPLMACWAQVKRAPLPDLSQWYEVPVGAIIPDGTTYVMKDTSAFLGFEVYCDHTDLIQEANDHPRYTERPIEFDADLAIITSIVLADDEKSARKLLKKIREEKP